MPAPTIADRVRETSTTTGTGTYSLSGTAVSGYVTFDSALFSGETCYYLATLGADWEVGIGTFTDATPDTLARTTIIASSNAGAAVSWGVGIKDISIVVPTRGYKGFTTYGGEGPLINGYVAYSENANAATFAIKTNAGADPSPQDPVWVVMRSGTLSLGTYVVREITAALSVTASSGSTLGAVASQRFEIVVVIIDDGTSLHLGIVNPRVDAAGTILLLDERNGTSTTAEGGAGGADSAGVIYTTTGQTTKPFRILAVMEWSSGMATPGTWSGTTPTLSTRHTAGVVNPLHGLRYVRTLKYTGSSSYSKPTYVRLVRVTVISGGGGGGGANNTDFADGGGGGGGGAAVADLWAAAIGASETITVGGGGAAGVNTGGTGGNGGSSSFGSHLSATGGNGGIGDAGSVNTGAIGGGTAGVGSGGTFNFTGSPGDFGLRLGTSDQGKGGNGGASALGWGGGGLGAQSGNGVNGAVPGGGGGGAGGSVGGGAGNGGTGGGGMVVVEEYA